MAEVSPVGPLFSECSCVKHKMNPKQWRMHLDGGVKQVHWTHVHSCMLKLRVYTNLVSNMFTLIAFLSLLTLSVMYLPPFNTGDVHISLTVL